jgi:hypothetical protein
MEDITLLWDWFCLRSLELGGTCNQRGMGKRSQPYKLTLFLTNNSHHHEDVWCEWIYGSAYFWGVVSFKPRPLYVRWNFLQCSFCRRLGGPYSRSGRYGEVRIFYLTRTRTPTRSHFQLVPSRYTDWSTAALNLQLYKIAIWEQLLRNHLTTVIITLIILRLRYSSSLKLCRYVYGPFPFRIPQGWI